MKFWASVALSFTIVFILGVLRNILPLCALQIYAYITHIFVSFYVASWIMQFTKEYLFTCKIELENKAVLITGCDSGFGNFLAKKFDKKGFTVFACCLDPTSPGAKDLKTNCSSKLHIIELNVTSDDSVNKVLKVVQNNLEDQTLWAIVNNAGVLRGFQTELSLMKDYEDCIQVNTLGLVRVTKAFLPLLRRSKGRIVNICSMAGRVTCPFLSPYVVSKHAAVAYTENIMYELREFGIRVISVEPEFFSTPMCSNGYLEEGYDRTLAKIPEEVKADYGEKYITSAKKCMLTIFNNSCPKTEKVIDAVEAAVTFRYPADVYKPCRNIFFKIIFFVGERIPREFYDVFNIVFFYFLGLQRAKTGEDNFTKLSNL